MTFLIDALKIKILVAIYDRTSIIERISVKWDDRLSQRRIINIVFDLLLREGNLT